MTVGTFDLYHWGHVNLFRQAKEQGDYLIVGVNTDDFVERFKGKRPVMGFFERMVPIVGCAWVDEVIANYGQETLRPLIRDFRPDKLVVGDDWRTKDYVAQTKLTPEYLEEHKCELVYVPYTKGISTTAIKERLRDY